jgi:hypothetical protein
MTNRRLVAVGAAVALGLAACDPADLTNYNENPNSPTSAPAPALFTNGVRTTVSRFLGNLNVRGFELMAQHLTEVQYPQSDQYVRLQSNSTYTTFDGAYYGELEDFQKVIANGQAANAPGYYAPAAIMQSWTFGELTDLWGDVPYSGALMGDSTALDTLAVHPAYDPQQAIYDGLFTTLSNAASALEGAPGVLSLGGADPIYGGDFGQWQKFANSLHARYAMRIVNVDQAKADAELQAAFNGPNGTFASNADNALLAWPGDGLYDNPWAANFQTRDDHRVSDRLMTLLTGWNDPRLPIFAQPVAGTTDEYVGAPNALPQADAATWAPKASRPGEIFYPGATSYGTFGGSGKSYPSYVMTYAELAFIKAEAAERGLGGLSPAEAKGFYEDAVRASMEQWGVSDAAAVDAYLAQPEVAYKGGTAGLAQIYTQKWIALYSDGIQSWSSWRRTCQPTNIHAGPAVITGGEVIRRFEYSTTEMAVNEAHVKEAVARQGEDNLTTRMWWDSAPENAPTCD